MKKLNSTFDYIIWIKWACGYTTATKLAKESFDYLGVIQGTPLAKDRVTLNTKCGNLFIVDLALIAGYLVAKNKVGVEVTHSNPLNSDDHYENCLN